MRVILDHRLFRSPHGSDLAELLHNANRLPHQLLVDGDAAGQRAKDSWVAEFPHDVRTRFERIFARGRSPEAVRRPPSVTLEVSNEKSESIEASAPDRLIACAHLERAKDLVREPLQLWLENDRNDAAFLRTVAPAGQYREWLAGAAARRWIEYRHGGGSDLGPKLRALDPWVRIRSWAMCDSDNWEPNVVSRQVETFRRASDALASTTGPRRPAVPLQVLRRRAIENYLPLPGLRYWANDRRGTAREQRLKRTEFVDGVGRLDAHSTPFNLRHYYHMEKGFGAEPAAIPACYDPFRAEPALASGIGSSIKRIYLDNLTVQEHAGHGWLDDAWLAQDTDLRDEAIGIIASIQRRI